MKEKEFVIIGAGQCGLSAGRFLQKAGKDFVILDQHREIGDSWRNRYGSLQLFTPAAYSQLPDLPMALSPKARPTKDQIADYFSRYATHFELPIHTKNTVSKVIKKDDHFIVKSSFEEIQAKHVIVANGQCQKPNVPEWADKLSVPFIHSSQYRTPISIKGKKVLVVGGGNSGAQIVAELTSFFNVHWSLNKKPNFKSLYLFGKNRLWWGDKLNVLSKPAKEKLIRKGEPTYLYDDLKKKIKKAKKCSEVVKAEGNQVTFADGKSLEVDFVLFATGFQPDFSFIQVDGFEHDLNQLREQDGISNISGLYFLGIPYQRSRSSQLIYGSQKDAAFIVQKACE
ncbi:NAD(P)/FAD-dependent oxidoreductase [Echinicola sp. 20G]|uniref:flavin-containing monooxygenase n=1 Tax=Echinicola sp. 20G TaxID=2781961 RepID=UPI0019100F9A|nr:NAD(P)-binding domain-containing protein [Echinicola sp. 20G]